MLPLYYVAALGTRPLFFCCYVVLLTATTSMPAHTLDGNTLMYGSTLMPPMRETSSCGSESYTNEWKVDTVKDDDDVA
jgi:hypothetical protein